MAGHPDYHRILRDADYADCAIVCKGDGTELNAHRAILASNSGFFTGLFRSPFSESRTCRVELQEHSLHVRAMLEILYTGRYSSPDFALKDHVQVAQALDKYQIMLFLEVAERNFSRRLSELTDGLISPPRHTGLRVIPSDDEVDELMEALDLLEERIPSQDPNKDFRSQIVGKILQHFKVFMDSDKFKEVLMHHESLGGDLLMCLGESREFRIVRSVVRTNV